MATHARIAIRALKTLSGYSIPRYSFPEAASQTFKKGAIVVLQAGYLQEAGTNPPLIWGVATKDGQNAASAGLVSQTIELAHQDTLFIGNLDDATSEDTGAGVAADRGKMYGLTKHATNGKWYIDKNKAAAATRRVIIWDLWDEMVSTNTGGGVLPAWTDVIPRVTFTFDSAFYQGNKTS